LFNENLIKDNTLTTLNPELVEKKEPPIITNIKKINDKFEGVLLKEIPKFDALLIMENNKFKKLPSSLKKTKINEKETTFELEKKELDSKLKIKENELKEKN
jgi:hypothetical protein